MLNPMDSFKFFLLVMFLGSVSGIMFNIHPNTQKCLRDEMVTRQLIGGEYEITDAPGQKVDILIRDSRGHILYQKEKISQGKFSFSSDVNDYFEVCFISVVPAQVRGVVQDVRLIIKKDIENKNYEAIIEAGNLKPMEVDLQKLEDLSNAIVTDFAAMRKREEQMRDTNESTNNRVLFFSIFGTCCLLGLATWQVLYLRRYFIAKKLI